MNRHDTRGRPPAQLTRSGGRKTRPAPGLRTPKSTKPRRTTGSFRGKDVPLSIAGIAAHMTFYPGENWDPVCLLGEVFPVPRKRLRLLVLALLLALTLTYPALRGRRAEVLPLPPPEDTPPPALGLKLGSGATVEYHWKYVWCGDEEIQEHPIPGEWAGMDPHEFKALDPDALVVEFTPQKVVVRRELEAWCPVHAVYRFITISGGRVTVYRGNCADPDFVLSQSVSAESLDAETRRVLEAGILTQRDEEVRRLLEGIGD